LADIQNINEKLTFRLKKGEKEAFQELFNLYAPKIHRFAIAYLKDMANAEELVQDVFMKIWEKRENLDPAQNIKAYIYKIAVNTVYDFVRKKNLEKAFADFSKHNFQPGAESLWHEIIWNEMLARLDHLVAQMPEQCRNIFILCKEEGLSNQEIAEKLNLSKRTVENQLYRAIRFLKEHLKPDTVFLLLFLYLHT
jgi:RNA polymerase sigma-70 factor (ECF subfamily)